MLGSETQQVLSSSRCCSIYLLAQKLNPLVVTPFMLQNRACEVKHWSGTGTLSSTGSKRHCCENCFVVRGRDCEIYFVQDPCAELGVSKGPNRNTDKVDSLVGAKRGSVCETRAVLMLRKSAGQCNLQGFQAIMKNA